MAMGGGNMFKGKCNLCVAEHLQKSMISLRNFKASTGA